MSIIVGVELRWQRLGGQNTKLQHMSSLVRLIHINVHQCDRIQDVCNISWWQCDVASDRISIYSFIDLARSWKPLVGIYVLEWTEQILDTQFRLTLGMYMYNVYSLLSANFGPKAVESCGVFGIFLQLCKSKSQTKHKCVYQDWI